MSSDWALEILLLFGLLLSLGLAGAIWFKRRSRESAEEKERVVDLLLRQTLRKGEALVQEPPASVLRVAPAVFVSYRREDTNDVTGRIYDRLVQHFGKEAIFKDVDSIPLGVDFRKHLGDSVGQCSVLLAIIGKEWLAGGSKTGGHGLSDARDYVKIEIESALQREIPVIPVLVQGMKVPREEDLPPSLQSLAYRNGIPVRADPDFHQDMDRLVNGIEAHLKRMADG